MAKGERAVREPRAASDESAGPEELIERISELVRGARSMPLSSSVMVHRQELFDLVDALKAALPEEIGRAHAILGDTDQVIERARVEAQRLIDRAKSDRETQLSKTEIVQAAARQADRLVAEAESQARRIRAEAEEYVESKLANFEVVLQKTLAAVERGRQRLAGRLEADQLAPDSDDEQGER